MRAMNSVMFCVVLFLSLLMGSLYCEAQLSGFFSETQAYSNVPLGFMGWNSNEIVNPDNSNSGKPISAVNGGPDNQYVFALTEGTSFVNGAVLAAVDTTKSGATIWTANVVPSTEKPRWVGATSNLVLVSNKDVLMGFQVTTGTLLWTLSYPTGFQSGTSSNLPIMVDTYSGSKKQGNCVFVMLSSTSSEAAQLIRVNLAGATTPTITSLWSSTGSQMAPADALEYTIDSAGSTIYMYQEFGSTWMGFSASLTSSAAQASNGFAASSTAASLSGLGGRTPLLVFDSSSTKTTAYFFGSSSGSNNDAQVKGYDLIAGTSSYTITVPNGYKAKRALPLYENGAVTGLGLYASSGGSCYFYTVFFNNTATTSLPFGTTTNTDCDVVSIAPSAGFDLSTDSQYQSAANAFYFLGEDDALHRYSFGSSSFAWSKRLFSGAFDRADSAIGVLAPVTNRQQDSFLGNPFQLFVAFNFDTTWVTNAIIQANAANGELRALFPTTGKTSMFLLGKESFAVGTESEPAVFALGTPGSTTTGQTGAVVFSLLPAAASGTAYAASKVVNGGSFIGTSMAQFSDRALGSLTVTSNDKTYFVTDNWVYCYGATNGTLMWSQYVASTTTKAFASSYAKPIVVGEYLYVLQEKRLSSDPVTISAFDVYNQKPVKTLTAPTTISSCASPPQYPAAFVTDPIAPVPTYVFYTGRLSNCIVRFTAALDNTGIFVAAVATGATSIDYTPVFTESYVVARASGWIWRWDKNALTGTPKKNKQVLGTSTPLVYGGKNLFVASAGHFYAFDVTTMSVRFSGARSNFDLNVAPIILAGGTKAFFALTNGSVAYFDVYSFRSMTPISTSSLYGHVVPTTKVLTPSGNSGQFSTTTTTASLGTPLVTPWGLLVFGTSKGIIAFDPATLEQSFVFSEGALGSPAISSCGTPLGYHAGLTFVLCSGTLLALDSLSGTIWLSIRYALPFTFLRVSVRNPNSRDFTVAAGADRYLSFSNVTSLYSPYAVPPPLGAPQDEPTSKFNLLWVGGVICAIIVVVMIVALFSYLSNKGVRDADGVSGSPLAASFGGREAESTSPTGQGGSPGQSAAPYIKL